MPLPSACFSYLYPRRKRPPLAAGHSAPPFALKQADGSTVGLASHKGQVVLQIPVRPGTLLVVSRCRGSRVSKTHGDKGLLVLDISLDDGGWKTVQPSNLQTQNHLIPYRPNRKDSDREGRVWDKIEFEKAIEQLLQT